MIPTQKYYKIEGMTCQSCVRRVKTGLEGVPGVIEAEVQLTAPQGRLTLDKDVPMNLLQRAIEHYVIEELSECSENSPLSTTE